MASRAAAAGEGDRLRGRVAEVFARHLPHPPASHDRTMFELGADSLMASNIVMDVERDLGVALPFEVLVEEPTIRQLAEWIAKQPPATTPFQPD